MKSEIIIRPPELADVDDLFELQQQPRYVWGTLQVPYMSRPAVRERLEQRNPNIHRLVAEIDGNVVGQISIHVSPRPRKNMSAASVWGCMTIIMGEGSAPLSWPLLLS